MIKSKQNKQKIRSIEGHKLHELFLHAISNVVKYKKTLDEINVFPVPDGDTGTNIAFTLLPILQYKDGIPTHAYQVFSLISNIALDSARGNSGTILAQFFCGMREENKDNSDLSVENFARSLITGSRFAKSALEKPVDGTIISVMIDVAQEAENILEEGCEDFYEFIDRIYAKSESSLKSTTSHLSVLKKTNVVDAGAYGFVLFLQGILDYLNEGISKLHFNIKYDKDLINSLSNDIKATYKYCTECVIQGNQLVKENIKQKIASLGDSLVIAGSQNKIKIHIHTDHPDLLFDICSQFGSIGDKKADDMSKQEHLAHNIEANSVAIVTDTAADLPDEYLADLHVINLRYSFGEQLHIDGVTQTSEEFYNQMAQSPFHPKTSQPPLADFKKTYSFVASHYESIISIHPSKKVSGTYQTALLASKDVTNNIAVIDSMSASAAQGFLTMHAIDLKRAGKSYSEIVESMYKKIKKIRVYFIIDDLSYAVKGGRLPKKIKSTVDFLRLRPVFTTQKGRIRVSGVLFGRENKLKKFLKFVRRKINKKKKYRMIVGHANAEPLAKTLLEDILCTHHKQIQISHILPISCALGVHGGPGSFGIGLEEIDS